MPGLSPVQLSHFCCLQMPPPPLADFVRYPVPGGLGGPFGPYFRQPPVVMKPTPVLSGTVPYTVSCVYIDMFVCMMCWVLCGVCAGL